VKLDVIKTIDIEKGEKLENPDEYRVACLYEIDRKPLIHIVRGKQHIRYMVKK